MRLQTSHRWHFLVVLLIVLMSTTVLIAPLCASQTCSFESCSEKPRSGSCPGPEARALAKNRTCTTQLSPTYDRSTACLEPYYGHMRLHSAPQLIFLYRHLGFNTHCLYNPRTRQSLPQCHHFSKYMLTAHAHCNLNEYCDNGECKSSLTSPYYGASCQVQRYVTLSNSETPVPVFDVHGLRCIHGRYSLCTDGEKTTGFDGSKGICLMGMYQYQGTSTNDWFNIWAHHEDALAYHIFCAIFILVLIVYFLWRNVVNVASFFKDFYLLHRKHT